MLREATSAYEVKSITLIRNATVFGPRGIFARQDKPLRPISRILSFVHAPKIKELVLRLGVTIRVIREELDDDPEPDNLHHIQTLLMLLDKMGWRLLLDSLDPFTALRSLRFDIVKDWCTGHNTVRYLEDAAVDALEEWGARGILRVRRSRR